MELMAGAPLSVKLARGFALREGSGGLRFSEPAQMSDGFFRKRSRLYSMVSARSFLTSRG